MLYIKKKISLTVSDGDGFSPRGVENVQDNAILPVKCESNFGGKKSKKTHLSAGGSLEPG